MVLRFNALHGQINSFNYIIFFNDIDIAGIRI